ncbi:PREDICTED: uncharacterized protein LOC107070504 [Polistes dominula]|uniref:Uncharacterized protein LOC107070504 n=1 Tax=Polistes dominula TaxID=743375 RepID=A0ABM1IVL6_POLDO|nr:PREDICTED: uncharacterized protein LOC107070504 [Polistes dominula]
MPFFNFFRNFFTGGERGDFGNEWKNSFRNPIWQNDEDDNDDDDFRHVEDNIIGDAMQMAHLFESQLDNMIKAIFSNFGDRLMITPGIIEELPQEGQSTNSLRDQVLKPGFDLPSEKEQEKSRVDIDLDGKISADNLFKTWDNKPDNREIVPSIQQFPQSSKFITKRSIRIMGDVIEEHQVIKDGEGNQKEILSKQIGNKKYVIETEKDKNGVETAKENIINIDESELQNFKPKLSHQDDNHLNNPSKLLNYFPWDKFFGPNPKL